jgi:tetratricopeptide (TPR) repeat protein
MRFVLRAGTVAVALVAFSACGYKDPLNPVPEDPASQLKFARDHVYSPWVDRYIREAEENYRQRDDKVGLAAVYRTYGLYYQLNDGNRCRDAPLGPICKWVGFVDNTANAGNHFEKSLENYDKALAFYAQLKRDDGVAVIHYLKGTVYYQMERRDDSCAEYSRAAEYLTRGSIVADELKRDMLSPEPASFQFGMDRDYPSYNSYAPDKIVASEKYRLLCP